MIAFTDTNAPRAVRIARALRYMKTLLGEADAPNEDLYRDLAERYGITRDDLARAWVKAGFQ